MLPGFRILLASVMLSASILIFGLGAAALLRAAHEEFVTVPSWREAQKPVLQLPNAPLPPLAQTTAETKPVLAMLKVEPIVKTPSEIKLPDPPKVASTTGLVTDEAAAPKIEAAQPARPRLRRAKRARAIASIRRQRAIRAARAARLGQQQQQQFANDPFRAFPTPSGNGG